MASKIKKIGLYRFSKNYLSEIALIGKLEFFLAIFVFIIAFSMSFLVYQSPLDKFWVDIYNSMANGLFSVLLIIGILTGYKRFKNRQRIIPKRRHEILSNLKGFENMINFSSSTGRPTGAIQVVSKRKNSFDSIQRLRDLTNEDFDENTIIIEELVRNFF